MSNPSELKRARQKALDDRQKLGKEKDNNYQSSLVKFDNKKKKVNIKL